MAVTVNEAAEVMREATRATIRKRSLWYLAQGLLLMVAGFVALISPLFASTFFVVFLGWLLIIAAVGQAIGLIGAGEVHYFWLQLLSAALSALVGFILVTRPEVGLFAASILLVVYFMVDGIQRLVFSLMIRPLRNWGWMLASGVMGILLSLLLVANLPEAAGWLIGLLLGIELISVGAAMAYLAWDLRRSTAL